jgi:hypothetical protein
VCRGFEDPDVIHVEDRVDPVADLEIIHNELRIKDLATVRLESAWKLPGSCLEAAWKLPGSFTCTASLNP